MASNPPTQVPPGEQRRFVRQQAGPDVACHVIIDPNTNFWAGFSGGILKWTLPD